MPGRRLREAREVVRGTVFVHRRRCGKPNCRCATGEAAHESTVLSYKEGGKRKFLMLPVAEVELVRMLTALFRAAKAQLDAQGNSGLVQAGRTTEEAGQALVSDEPAQAGELSLADVRRVARPVRKDQPLARR